MAREDPQINIRMPAGLKAALEAAAAEHTRSVTAEIVARLEQSLRGPKHPPNIIIRLEVLRQGSGSLDIPLGEFFQTMSSTIREITDAHKAEERAARKLERDAARQSDSILAPAGENDSSDAGVADAAAQEFRQRQEEKKTDRRARELEGRPSRGHVDTPVNNSGRKVIIDPPDGE